MAIQLPNPGLGDGQTGDNEFVMWTKTKDNFNNSTHAASRLVGTSNGNVVEMTGTGIAGLGYGANAIPSVVGDLNEHSNQTRIFRGDGLINAPDIGWICYQTFTHSNIFAIQTAHHLIQNKNYIRRQGNGVWGAWTPLNSDISTFDTTTASGANVVVNAAGRLTRASSSERYKDIIADLELDDENYADAMSLSPIIYRSKSEIDNPNYHYYSFSAEALGAHDPAFTLWRDTETVTDADGITTEQPLAERVAEGLNLNAIVAFLHATNVKQGKLIDELSARIGVLEDANK